METAELVHAEALRLLQEQVAELDTIRARSVAILSAAGLVNGLFGVKVAGGHHSTGQPVCIWIALVMFASMAGLVIAIELPRDFAFAERLDNWIAAIGSGERREPREYLWHFSRRYAAMREENKTKISQLYNLFAASCILLGAQVLSWGISVVLA